MFVFKSCPCFDFLSQSLDSSVEVGEIGGAIYSNNLDCHLAIIKIDDCRSSRRCSRQIPRARAPPDICRSTTGCWVTTSVLTVYPTSEIRDATKIQVICKGL